MERTTGRTVTGPEDHQNDRFWRFLVSKNWLFWAKIRKKHAFKRSSLNRKNPPIYTVLNGAFWAISWDPPWGVTVVTSHPARVFLGCEMPSLTRKQRERIHGLGDAILILQISAPQVAALLRPQGSLMLCSVTSCDQRGIRLCIPLDHSC